MTLSEKNVLLFSLVKNKVLEKKNEAAFELSSVIIGGWKALCGGTGEEENIYI